MSEYPVFWRAIYRVTDILLKVFDAPLAIDIDTLPEWAEYPIRRYRLRLSLRGASLVWRIRARMGSWLSNYYQKEQE